MLHLLSEKMYEDCLLQLKMMKEGQALDHESHDSLEFYTGYCLSKKGLFDSAAVHHFLVGPRSAFYERSRLNSSFDLANAGRPASGEDLLQHFPLSDSLTGLRNYFLSSLSLLRNDVKGFEQQASGITDPYFSHQYSLLSVQAKRLRKAEHKSAFLAGMMSAVVPGTGKIYTGKVRAGFTSMVPVLIMGAQAYEAYRKDGIKSPRFIVFGSLFSVFYIGNIWGSALSVSVRKQEIQHEVHTEVLLGMRIALHHAFGEGS